MVKKVSWVAAFLGAIIGACLFLLASPALGQKPPPEVPPPLEELRDANGNKVFDNLEKRLAPAGPDESFPVIVLFNLPLDEIDFPPLKREIGDFPVQSDYPSIQGIATTLTKGQIIAASRLGLVKQIEYDMEVRAFLDQASYWFGVQKVRTDLGVDGDRDGNATSYSKDDIVIAVVDTGIDTGHVDLDGGKVIGWKDFTPPSKGTPYDDNGHGTHVSSIAAGTGEGNSAYKGVAPGAALVGVKVLNAAGSGTVSGVNAGLQWVIDNKATYGIEVMNISLGIAGSSDGTDSTSVLVNAAVDAGIVVAVAAGNEGPARYTIGSPAAAAKGITVGAMADVNPGSTGSTYLPDRGFYLAYFSSRGPTADGRIKPDIAGPGVAITAAKYNTSNQYISYSGTSMSTPFLAGVVALMLDARPTLTPGEVKSLLESTAVDWGPPGKDIDYGAGRLDGYEAVRSAATGGTSGPSLPSRRYYADSLSSTNTQDWWNIPVTTTAYPIAVTMIMPNWVSSSNPDFDMELYAPDNTLLASSVGITRQETIGYQPGGTGTYKLRVYRYRGAGDYFFDLSAGADLGISISLTTDGTIGFGAVDLGATVDSTSDAQRARVDAGPASLKIKTSLFSDGANTWSLGSASGAETVKWEFSPDGTGWNLFSSADALYLLAGYVSPGATQQVYLRLSMPTSTSSSNPHSTTLTIVATAP